MKDSFAFVTSLLQYISSIVEGEEDEITSTTSAAIKKTKPIEILPFFFSFGFVNCVHLFAYFHSNTNVEIISVLQNSSN
jgi:hypothetical protein